MGQLIVIEFVTLDGVIQDPDGSGGQPWGGWAFRYGPEAVAGDKFKLGDVLDTGVMVLGRATWQLFSRIWPSRTDDFSQKMNALPKVVASRSLSDVTEWDNSTLLSGDLVTEMSKLKQTRDVVVTGSISVVDTLRAHDLVDQYRLLVFPVVLGQGRRLFDQPGRPVNLELGAAETVGQAVRLTYDRKPAR
ncbi:dihydrofolate reductase family protein [Micromonospora sp. NPDC051006]|uniref:dihydrofolate reductase family protein n=1 Tax=Micromonospora sp. NPDC051006 TaxID=3364283 RepID=UPI00379DF5E3